MNLRRRLARIRGVVCDVDGVLTDGGLYFGERGRPLKRFHVHDGMAVRMLQAMKIRVAFVSGDDSPVTRARAKRLDVPDVVLDSEDKRADVERLAERWRLPLSALAFIGDDVNDVPPMRAVGLAVAVADARPEAVRAAKYVTRARGGCGALREVVDLIREAHS